MAASSNVLEKYDPEKYRDNCYDEFIDFCDAFAYEYVAIAKDPPSDVADKAAWIQVNKRKIFLGRFASRNLQKDFEEVVRPEERSNIKFDDMVAKLKARYKPLRNTTLGNYEFHQLRQKEDESFDIFINRVKQETKPCLFKCTSDTCTVEDTMIRDQIISGNKQ